MRSTDTIKLRCFSLGRLALRPFALHPLSLRRAARMLAAGLLSVTSGCYSYTYHLREPSGGPATSEAPGSAQPVVDLQRVAIENSPHSDVRWSLWWGGSGDEWSPVECLAKDAAGQCTQQVPYCDKGLGQVEVTYPAWGVLLTIVTLGIAVPMRVSAWCSADSAPHHGP